MRQNIIAYLKTNLPYLTGVEKRIAGRILEDPEGFITYSMPRLAEETGVSQGSIINFSRKFAQGGFPELKLLICAGIGNTVGNFAGDVNEKDSMKDALAKNMEACRNAFELTREVNDEKTLERVVQKILNARKIEIYGIFRSASVAADFCYQLLEIGIPASFVSDILTCSISAVMLDKHSLVIAVSSSGKTKDIIDAVKNAKANKVPVVSITSNAHSPLARLSDDVLIASSGGTGEGSATEIRFSQLLLTDTICSYIRSRLDRGGKERYLGIQKILSSHSIEEGENA